MADKLTSLLGNIPADQRRQIIAEFTRMMRLMMRASDVLSFENGDYQYLSDEIECELLRNQALFEEVCFENLFRESGEAVCLDGPLLRDARVAYGKKGVGDEA